MNYPILLAAYALLLIFSLASVATAQTADNDPAEAAQAQSEARANVAGASAVIDGFHDNRVADLFRGPATGDGAGEK